MPTLEPVPQTPIRDDPIQDAIWKRWLQSLRTDGVLNMNPEVLAFAAAHG